MSPNELSLSTRLVVTKYHDFITRISFRAATHFYSNYYIKFAIIYLSFFFKISFVLFNMFYDNLHLFFAKMFYFASFFKTAMALTPATVIYSYLQMLFLFKKNII